MNDIVIDTCTLVHADNPESEYFEHSVKFINKMVANSFFCTVDEGFTLDESTHSSYIALEYIKHLRPTSLGYYLISHIAQNMRFNFVSNKVPKKDKNLMEQKIKNKKDIHFLRVTYNSTKKILASHDFTDYQKKKRKFIKKELGICIVTAEEINDEL
jgi:predicted nucleic acid-binding protein